jgi:RimJ/RimL family protein N-acetyltransferase
MRDLLIETALLRLHHLVPADAASMMVLNAEPTTRKWLPSHVYPKLGEALARIEYLISCYATPGHPRQGPYVLAVEHEVDGKLLRHVGFGPFQEDAEVSYAIAESARGQGYGTEALVCGCNWVCDVFAIPRVLAITESATLGSRRLLGKASFIQGSRGAHALPGHRKNGQPFPLSAREQGGLTDH